MKKILSLAVWTLLIPSFAFASFDRNLKFGMTGNDVSDLQDILSESGCLTHVATGYFGLLTLNAVKCWQAQNNIPNTGYFGILSRGAANRIVEDALSTSNAAEVSETGTTTPVVAPTHHAPTIVTVPVYIYPSTTPVPAPSAPTQAAPVTPTYDKLNYTISYNNGTNLCIFSEDVPNYGKRYGIKSSEFPDGQSNAGWTDGVEIGLPGIYFSNMPKSITGTYKIKIDSNNPNGDAVFAGSSIDVGVSNNLPIDLSHGYTGILRHVTQPQSVRIVIDSFKTTDGQELLNSPITSDPVVISQCQ